MIRGIVACHVTLQAEMAAELGVEDRPTAAELKMLQREIVVRKAITALSAEELATLINSVMHPEDAVTQD